MKKQSIVRKIAMGIICLSMVVTSLGMSGFTQVVYADEEGYCSACGGTGKTDEEAKCSACGGYGHLHNKHEIDSHYSYIEVNADETSHSIKCNKSGCEWSMEGRHEYDDGNSGFAIRNECGVCGRACTHDMFFSDNPEDIIKQPTCTEDGLLLYRCSYGCTCVETRIIPAGHIYVYKITSGSAVKYICDLDGHDIERECNDNCIKHSNDEYSCGRITLYASASNTTYSGDDNLASFDRDGIEYWNSSSRVELPTFTYAYKSASEGEYATTTDTKKVGYYKATIERTTLNLEYEVSKATPTLSFSRLSDKYNSVQGAGVTLSPTDDSATSKIRVEYKIENKWTTTAPTAIGSYPVRAYMPEGTDNLNAVALENAITGTYVIEQYVAPNPPSGGGGGGSTGGGGTSGGGAGNSEIGDGTTTETKPDGTTVETKTETSDDGTKTETVVESKPDGTKTETITEEKADGSKTETITKEKPDGSKSETVTETAKDGSTVETKTETAKNGSKTESIKETSADGKTSSSIEVKTNANGKVTESVVAVDKAVKGKKLTIDMSAITDMIAKNDNATKKNTTVVLTANDKNGKEKFTVDVDAKNLKAGAELKIYAIDKKGNPVIVDASKNNVTVTKTGDIKLNIAGTGDFTIVTPKEAAKMEKAIEKSVKPAKTQVTVEQGMKATFKLDSGCNKDNIAKIIYKSDNANVKVNKNGKITVKDSVNATITATVTLANGKTKTITMKVKGK